MLGSTRLAVAHTVYKSQLVNVCSREKGDKTVFHMSLQTSIISWCCSLQFCCERHSADGVLKLNGHHSQNLPGSLPVSKPGFLFLQVLVQEFGCLFFHHIYPNHASFPPCPRLTGRELAERCKITFFLAVDVFHECVYLLYIP